MVLSPTEHLDGAKISSNGFKFSTIVFRVIVIVLVTDYRKYNAFNSM